MHLKNTCAAVFLIFYFKKLYRPVLLTALPINIKKHYQGTSNTDITNSKSVNLTAN